MCVDYEFLSKKYIPLSDLTTSIMGAVFFLADDGNPLISFWPEYPPFSGHFRQEGGSYPRNLTVTE